MDKKIIVYMAVIIILATISFFAGSITTKHRLVEQHRLELDAARARSEQYESIYRQAREANRELGECLSKSVATLSGLRLQISEVRSRYEKMEKLLNDSGDYNNNSWDFNSSINTSNGEIKNE